MISGSWVMAASVAIAVIITRPMLADVVDQRAMNEQVAGNYTVAIALANRALLIDSNAHAAAARIIRMERESGHFDRALADADNFERHGSSDVVRSERARVLFAMKRYPEAAKAFDVELSDANVVRTREHRFLLADVMFAETAWELSGNRVAARAELARGLTFAPGNKTFGALEQRL